MNWTYSDDSNENVDGVDSHHRKRNVILWDLRVLEDTARVEEHLCDAQTQSILQYIKFRVKNAESLQSLYRHFKIYSQNKRWKGRKEQMRF